MKTSVILPARNEEKLIKEVVLDVYKYLKKKKYSFEILVIVNGTSDNTENIVNSLSKKYKEIKCLESAPGYGYALRKGLEAAKGKYVVIYNVDFYDLKLVDLIDIDMYGKDFIIGSKRAHWSNDNRPLSRRLISYIFNLYLNIVHGFKGSDTHGIKLIKRDVINKIFNKCETQSGIFDTELVIRAQKNNYKLADFPVTVVEKRPPRFSQRILQTPIDIYNLSKSLWKIK